MTDKSGNYPIWDEPEHKVHLAAFEASLQAGEIVAAQQREIESLKAACRSWEDRYNIASDHAKEANEAVTQIAERNREITWRYCGESMRGPMEDIAEFHKVAEDQDVYSMSECKGRSRPLFNVDRRLKFADSEHQEWLDAIEAKDAAECLDALIDRIYIDLGTAYIQFGRKRTVAAWAEVHQTNMAKRGPDGRFKIVNGKIQKPEGWVAPDIRSIVEGPA